METKLKIEELKKEKLELRKELIDISNILKTCKESGERKELIAFRKEIMDDIKDIELEIISLSEVTEEQLEVLESQIDNDSLDKEAEKVLQEEPIAVVEQEIEKPIQEERIEEANSVSENLVNENEQISNEGTKHST